MKKTAITAGQIKKIHTLKTCLGLDDATYRGILFESFRVNSSKQLTMHQADLLIHDLEDKAVAAGVWQRRRNRRQRFKELSGRSGMATAPQLRMIEAMWQDVSRVQDPENRRKALRVFVNRVAKVSDLRFLDQAGAGKVINALKEMQKQKNVSGREGEKGC